MPTTARFALPYPLGSDAADVPFRVEDLADAVDAAMAGFSTGSLGARPAAGTAGRFYYATDAATLALDTGSTWVDIGPPSLALPAGLIAHTGAATAPSGWLICDGAAVSRATYAALFAAIGTGYGAGNGTTTFNLPDLRSRTILGAGSPGGGLTTRVPGDAGGTETHALTTAELPGHTHTTPAHTHGVGTLATATAGAHTHQTASGNNLALGSAIPLNIGSAVTLFPWVYSETGSPTTGSAGSHTHTITGATASGGSGSTGSAGSGSAHPNLPPFGVGTPIIKT